jgi:hypothetical protein
MIPALRSCFSSSLALAVRGRLLAIRIAESNVSDLHRSGAARRVRDGAAIRMEERIADYLSFGIPNVWVLETAMRHAWSITLEGGREFTERGTGALVRSFRHSTLS